MSKTIFAIVFLACFTKFAFCGDYYTVIGSKTIKPNSQYPVTVSLVDATKSSTIKLSIQNDKNFKLTNSIVVEPRTSKVVQFAIGRLDPGSYKLIAEGTSGLPFVSETLIGLPSKNQSIYIQTDKAMYKPGDKVKFRVLVLDSASNPGIINKMDVLITNADNNKIKLWSNVATTLGVYNQELQLASNPPLGVWKINVDVNNERQSKDFEVAEYVLPKFEVNVIAPKDATYFDNVVRILINAKYTFGQNVKGKALVSIVPIDSFSPSVEKNIELNGSASVELRIDELQVDYDKFENTFDVKVSVNESLTGNVMEDTTTLSVRKTKFIIKDLDDDKKYAPGTSFILTLQSTYHDGSPYVNTNAPIYVNYGVSDMTLMEFGYMDPSGLAKINITIPDTASNGVYLSVDFLEFSERIGFYNKQHPRIFSDQYSVTATLISRNIKVNDIISILINSPKPLSYVNYVVSSRGNSVLSNKKDIPNKDSFTITLKASFEMVPSAKFLAYYVLPTGELVSTSIDIPVKGLNNFVTVKTSAVERQPGEKVNVILSSKPSSNVCLLGVDQSVVLLKTGNDIVLADVYAEMNTYNEIMPAQSSFANFESANLFIITNAVMPPRIISANKGNSISNLLRSDLSASALSLNEISLIEPNFRNAAQPRVRKYFPETWLWTCNALSSGSLTIPQVVPDTITSWYITAFATNTKFGLGVTEDKTVFKVFKKFFISLNLPYSIKQGETVALSIVVFNYMSQRVTATVTLDNSRKEFEFAEPYTQIYRNKGCPLDIESSRTKYANVSSSSGEELTFLITSLVSRPIKIKVTATSPIAGDAVEVVLPVVPEGVTQYKTKAALVDLRKTKVFTTDFTVDVPANAVKDSTQVSFSLIGEFMGVTLQCVLNHQNIIHYPHGCGEQNMIKLAPDVVILIYLTRIGRLTIELKTQLISFLEIGYQSQLSYMHPDGSFSVWGRGDGVGSTWLTAFVIRTFVQASDFITIDNGIISKGLEWLKSLQKSDGSIPELGRVHHYDMQGHAQQGVALTAYVVTAFVQTKAIASTYANVIVKALDYVKTKLDSFEDIYSLAVACYAAQVANHSSKTVLLQRLDKLAKIEGEYKYWERVRLQTDPWCQASTVNVEITSYTLLAYIKAGRILDAAPIAKWLLSQQSPNGGFVSTQDTVMAITALAEYYGEFSGVGMGATMSCSLTHASGQSTFKIDNNNLQVLQSVELPRTTKSAKLTCTGNGTALAHFSYQYNLNTVESETSRRFGLTVEVDKKSNDFLLILHICTNYITVGTDNVSNMAIVEAELPTGFVADLQTIKETVGSNVRKVESKNGNTVVVLYLDSVGANQMCFKIIAYRSCQIADHKPVAVQVYDYYNNIRRRTVFYQVQTKNLCGICADSGCRDTCKKPLNDVTCPKRA